MRRCLLVIAMLGLAACGRGTNEGGADVAAGTTALNPDVETCFEMATERNWAEAATACAKALEAEPDNARVKTALGAANAALAAEPAASSAEGTKEGAPN